MRRKKLSNRKSRRQFKASAGTHPKNVRSRPQRGGIRL